MWLQTSDLVINYSMCEWCGRRFVNGKSENSINFRHPSRAPFKSNISFHGIKKLCGQPTHAVACQTADEGAENIVLINLIHSLPKKYESDLNFTFIALNLMMNLRYFSSLQIFSMLLIFTPISLSLFIYYTPKNQLNFHWNE